MSDYWVSSGPLAVCVLLWDMLASDSAQTLYPLRQNPNFFQCCLPSRDINLILQEVVIILLFQGGQQGILETIA